MIIMEDIMHKMTKKEKWFFIVKSVICAGVLCFSCLFMNSTAEAKLNKLQVKGTKVVDSKGKEVQLKGVSTHGIAWFPEYVNKKQFASWKKFGANTVRLALYSDKDDGFSTSLYKKVEEGVKYATELNMYVIIDWHILRDGNPKTNQKQATAFFTKMAKKYANYTNVIYEICNEPNSGATWEKDIKPYARKMYSVIRKYDKEGIIIVGTPNWSQDVDVVAKSPLTKVKNVMYSLHFYAATHTDWIREKATTAIKDGLPIFVSEFSICESTGSGRIDTKSADKWMKLIRKYKLPYVGWNVSNKNETSSLLKSSCKKTGTIKKSDLSKTGQWLIKQFKK